MIPALDTALYTKLGGTATTAGTALYSPIAPDGAALPYIVWDYVADIEENETSVDSQNELVFVRCYSATKSEAGTIDGQIKTLLHKKPLTVTGHNNFWIARENAYSLSETDQSGRKTFMAGAEYRVRLEVT